MIYFSVQSLQSFHIYGLKFSSVQKYGYLSFLLPTLHTGLKCSYQELSVVGKSMVCSLSHAICVTDGCVCVCVLRVGI